MADELVNNDCDGAYRSNDDPQPAMIMRANSRPKAVLYAAVDNVAIVEGDIAIGTTTNEGEFVAFRGIIVSGDQFRWPKKTIPYKLAPGFVAPERVTEAIAIWERDTEIRFVKQTNEIDFVEFVNGNGCFSAVGRQGGRQVISLGVGCTKGNAIHEIGHAVGLWHEQSREDRNQHITVQMQNVKTGFEHNFDQQITDGDDVGAYDYESVMHYPAKAFSKNGEDTIVPKLSGVAIGQRDHLSAGDIAAVKKMYENV